MLPFVFRESCGFSDYAEYALDVPMYFIVRDGRWTDMTAYTFRRFWKEGYQGERATLADWNAHLTTLFPEFRLKGYIEARSIDSQAPELMLAVPALIKGIFYEADCLAAAWDLVKRGPGRSASSCITPCTGRRCAPASAASKLRELARELLEIGRRPGAEMRQRQLDAAGESEALYLASTVASWCGRPMPGGAADRQVEGGMGSRGGTLDCDSSYRIAA